MWVLINDIHTLIDDPYVLANYINKDSIIMFNEQFYLVVDKGVHYVNLYHCDHVKFSVMYRYLLYTPKVRIWT